MIRHDHVAAYEDLIINGLAAEVFEGAVDQIGGESFPTCVGVAGDEKYRVVSVDG